MEKEKLLSIDEIAAKYGLDREVVFEIASWGVDYQRQKWGFLCAVCDAELTEEERKYSDPYAPYKCCNKHLELRRYYQIDLIREREGYPPYRPFGLGMSASTPMASNRSI